MPRLTVELYHVEIWVELYCSSPAIVSVDTIHFARATQIARWQEEENVLSAAVAFVWLH